MVADLDAGQDDRICADRALSAYANTLSLLRVFAPSR
jgi:hypothetical protein